MKKVIFLMFMLVATTLFSQEKGVNYTTGAPITYEMTYRQPSFLLVTLLSGVVAYDQFSRASDYSTQISDMHVIWEKQYPTVTLQKQHPLDTSDLSSKQTSALIFGISASAVGVISTIYALSPITVTVTLEKVNLSYNF